MSSSGVVIFKLGVVIFKLGVVIFASGVVIFDMRLVIFDMRLVNMTRPPLKNTLKTRLKWTSPQLPLLLPLLLSLLLYYCYAVLLFYNRKEVKMGKTKTKVRTNSISLMTLLKNWNSKLFVEHTPSNISYYKMTHNYMCSTKHNISRNRKDRSARLEKIRKYNEALEASLTSPTFLF